MDVMDYLLVIRVNYKKKNSFLNYYLEKPFCQANCFNFQSNQDNFFCQTFGMAY